MKTADSHKFRVQAQPSLHMSDPHRHIADIATVNAASILALAISLSDVEQWIRIVCGILAAAYTAVKLYQTLKNPKTNDPRF